MKDVIAFLTIFFVGSLYANVVSPRYDEPSVYLGLPSMVTFSGGETVHYSETSEAGFKSSDISLPETHHVKLMGETYKTLRVGDNGRVYFIPDHELKDTLWFGFYHSFENEFFVWKAYDGDELDENDVNQDRFMTVINQDFIYGSRHFRAQYVIYPDGELQIQLWNMYESLKICPSWFSAKFFDGDKLHSMPNFSNIDAMELVGPNDLRPGWVAKAMRTEDAKNMQFKKSKKGLHVFVDGDNAQLGGVIANDNSREHPVVGSFSSVEIQTEGISENIMLPFYCWYFNEFYEILDAKYPYEKSFSKDYPNFSLFQSDFEYTWNAYKNEFRTGKDGRILPSYTENKIQFIKAPAIKFQRAGVSSDFVPEKFDFYITSINYRLAQLPSVQFLTNRPDATLKIKNGVGGRFEISGLKGSYDDNDDATIYELHKDQKFLGTIKVFPGNEIDVINVASKNGGMCIDNVNVGDDVQVACNVYFKKLSDDIVEFKGSVKDFTFLDIRYKSCSKRDLKVVPEIHKTESFSSSGDDAKTFETASILNAFGAEIQRQEKISSDKYMISTSYSNDMNQTTYVPMNFVHKNSLNDFKYVDLACFNCIALANKFYGGQDPVDRPDALGFAYTEQENYNGQNGVVSSVGGIAKRSLAYQSENNAKSWSIPVASDEEFIPYEHLDESRIEKIFKENMELANVLNYTLTVSRGSDGKFTQQISDSRGLLKSSWYYNGYVPVISLYEYDKYGNLVETKLKNDERLVAKNTYDAQGRIATSESNDRGLSEYRYDSFGRLRFTRSAMQKKKGEFSAMFYDDMGRTVALGIVKGNDNDFDNPDGDVPANVRYVSKTIYGKPDAAVLQQYGIPQELVNDILNTMDNVRPNDIGAVVSFDEKGNTSKIVMSSYNIIGMNTDKWIYVGLKNFPAVRLQYEYNDSKEPVRTCFSQWNGTTWEEKRQRLRNYDEKGKLMWIKERIKNGDTEEDYFLAKYSYTEIGNVKSKKYYDKDDDKPVLKKSISADVYGRVTGIKYKNSEDNLLYSTTLGFADDLKNTVKSLEHSWKKLPGGKEEKRNRQYEYDYNDRLVSVTGDMKASYGFDEIGRMERKSEGPDVVEYAYANPSYRPSGYSVNGESETKDVEYFRYDASGNIWYDKHNKVVYKNSELGLPLKITTFTNMPSNITLEDVNEEKDFANVESVVDVTYDEAGNRLWYSVDNRVRNEKWIEVTLPGIGVFRSQDADAANPTYELVREDLVAGAFRDAGGMAHFPLLDAQGSVRGYVTKSGVESAYDYYPYGTVVEISPNAGDDNKRWQSKEFDNEHGKYYFGSRYFDPFFGMWMSPDPAGQFANPYTYGGDPINFVDPNGEETITTGAAIGIAAAISAIFGGASAAYQCSKYGAGSCSVAISQGAIVGAAAGAAGGAAGFAAGGAAAAYGSIDAAVASGLASGTASSATSYIGNGLFTGDMSWGEGVRDIAFGALSGVATSSFGMNGYNLWAKNGAEIIAGSFLGGLGSMMHGGSFLDGLRGGALMSTTSAFLNTAINKVVDAGSYDGAISKDGIAGLQEGDILVFEVDRSSFGSEAISWLTGEDYTHAAYVDKDLKTGELFFREATQVGQEIKTSINSDDYIERRYKVIGNAKALPYMPYEKNMEGGYRLFSNNCTTKVTRWTGLRHTNNPGILARYMGAASMPYYNNLSLQHIIWRKFAW